MGTLVNFVTMAERAATRCLWRNSLIVIHRIGSASNSDAHGHGQTSPRAATANIASFGSVCGARTNRPKN